MKMFKVGDKVKVDWECFSGSNEIDNYRSAYNNVIFTITKIKIDPSYKKFDHYYLNSITYHPYFYSDELIFVSGDSNIICKNQK